MKTNTKAKMIMMHTDLFPSTSQMKTGAKVHMVVKRNDIVSNWKP
jgi:hypothetical protein